MNPTANNIEIISLIAISGDMIPAKRLFKGVKEFSKVGFQAKQASGIAIVFNISNN